MPYSFLEQGRRFSEDAYATKDDVKAVYNQDDVEDVWKNVLTYRSFYDTETDLKDNNGLSYKISLTKSISSRSYGLERKLLNDELKYVLLKDDLKKEFAIQREAEAIKSTAISINQPVTDNMIRKIVLNEIETIPSSLFVLKAFHEGYQYAMKMPRLDLEAIETINCLVSGETLEKTSPHYRKNNLHDILNPLSPCPAEEIPSRLESLLSFLGQEEIPTILRALSIPYVFFSLRPFEFYNEETACLVAKCFLKTNGLDMMGFVLNIESICYATSNTFFGRLKLTEASLDLTYVLSRFLPFVLQNEGTISESLSEFSIQNISQNGTFQDGKTTHENDIKVIDGAEYALPTFPLDDSLETIEARSRKLKEIHPQLKPKQAHFYAGHCTIGLHYTIDQFKKEEKTVYETARTSMEDLANRGFYKKELIGKRFVYSPIPLKDNLDE